MVELYFTESKKKVDGAPSMFSFEVPLDDDRLDGLHARRAFERIAKSIALDIEEKCDRRVVGLRVMSIEFYPIFDPTDNKISLTNYDERRGSDKGEGQRVPSESIPTSDVWTS
jgi:hypothetical protein